MKDVVLEEVKSLDEIAKGYGQNRKYIILLVKICKDNSVRDIYSTIKKYLNGVSK